MAATPWLRLDAWARKLLPFAMTVLLVMLSVTPLHVPALGTVAPALSLMAVYYWAIFRPDLLPALAVFAVGLFQDVLGGLPLGVTALALLAVFGVVSSQRRFFLGKSFLVMWWGFMLIAAGVTVAMWLLLSALSGTLIAPGPVVVHFLLTLALFPCFTWLFIRVQQAFLQQV
jgi:rod shape-determining protein MreD